MSISGTTFKISTGLQTKAWDRKFQRVAKVEDFYFEKNNLLDLIEKEAEAIQYDCKRTGIIPDKEFIKARIQALKKPEKVFVVTFVHQYIRDYKQRKKSSLSEGHLKNFTSLANDVEAGWPMLTFADLDSKWMQDFVDHLLEAELSTNTIAKKVREIKAVAVDARRRGEQINPSFEEFKFRSITYPVFYLTWNEVEEIRKVSLTPAKDQVRDRFIFRCFTGMREGEMDQITPENFTHTFGNFLEYWDIKAKKMKSIQLNDPAFQIAEKYAFKLPKISQQKENEYIKEIAKRAGLTDQVKKLRHSGSKLEVKLIPKYKMISTHTARRSFARRWYDQGGDLMKLSRYLGHSSIKTTQIYIGLNDQEANDEMIRLFK